MYLVNFTSNKWEYKKTSRMTAYRKILLAKPKATQRYLMYVGNNLNHKNFTIYNAKNNMQLQGKISIGPK